MTAEPAERPIAGDSLKEILRHFATGVTVITSVNEHGEPAGMTATAFTSVSVSPPMVLVCVNAAAHTRRAIDRYTRFAVNVLAASQQSVAQRFASSGGDKFEGVRWHPGATGVPLLNGALATVECRVAQTVEAGTHLIYIGVVLAGSSATGEPLVYHEGSYRRLAP